MQIRPEVRVSKESIGSISRVTACMLTLALFLCLTGCTSSGSNSGTPSQDTIQVLTSIRQWSALAQELGGDKVKAEPIINNPNADAHDYEPTTSDIGRIGRADIVIVNGANYDSWASKAAQTSESKLIDIAEVSGHKAGDNPHLWFSGEVRAKAAEMITRTYQEKLPDDKQYFAERYNASQQREQTLHERLNTTHKKISGLNYVASESVAFYLAQDLGLQDDTPVGFSQAVANESEPSATDIHAAQQLLLSKKAKLLIINTQEAGAVSDQLENAAHKADVPIVQISEQMPSQYHDLFDWISDLLKEFEAVTDVFNKD